MNNCRQTKESHLSFQLSPGEIKNAVLKTAFVLQTLEYAAEIKELKNGSSISKSSKLKDLNPFLDVNGILRVGGRPMNASISYDEKHPIILPPHYHVTKLLSVPTSMSNCFTQGRRQFCSLCDPDFGFLMVVVLCGTPSGIVTNVSDRRLQEPVN